MLEVFKLLGTIAINNSDANKEIDETANIAGKAKDKINGAFGKIGSAAVTVGKTITAGLVAGATAIGALTKASIESYAEYEQLVGGVETLFKDSSDVVMKYAENAYKTAGMSANNYMETVTSFSASLLQGLGGDTAAAAEYADMAITDMSDNANKMGTDISMIQNAYQGFAKQNYTMLDNLKLGYGGTKEEMERLLADAEKISGVKYDLSSYADVVDAIHVIQTEMGITGTTAKEASSTISGSIASMKASWSNLLTAISDDDADFGSYINRFVESVSTVADNLMPRIEIALNGVVSLVDKLAPMIIQKIPELLKQLLPAVIEAATGLINSIVGAIPGLVKVLVESLPLFIDGIQQIFAGIVQALPTLIQTIFEALPTLIPMIIDAITGLIVTLSQNLVAIIQPIIENLPAIIVSIIDGLMANLPALINGIIQLVLALVAALPQIIQALVDAIPTVISTIIEALFGALPQIIVGLVRLVAGIVVALPEIFVALIEGVGNIFKGIWEGIKKVFSNVAGWFGEHFSGAAEAISKAWSGVKNFFGNIWNGIVNIFASVREWFKNTFSGAWNGIKDAWSSVKDFFSNIWNGIKNTFASVGDWFKNTFSKAWNGIKNVFSGVKNFFGNVWSGIKNVFSNVGGWFKNIFSSAWNGVKNVFSGVGNFFTGLWNKIKSAFTSLGVKIRDAITGPVKAGINGMLSVIEGVINGFLKMINGAIWLINKIPGVNISEVKLVHFTRLAKGGVVDEPTPAIFGEDGAEAVVPLEKNDGWLRKTAKKLYEFSVKEADGGITGTLSTKSLELQWQQVSEAQNTNEKLDQLISLLAQFFPQILETAGHDIYFNGRKLAFELAPDMNAALGQLSSRKDRGR